MNFCQFLKLEINDRKSQKGLGTIIWNIIFFPITVLINYYSFRKWLKLLDNLGLDFSDLKEKIKVRITEEKITFRKHWKYQGEYQLNLNFNECYVVETDVLFIFPYNRALTKNDFFNEIKEPFVISLKKERHPYQTLWDLPTLVKIQNVQFDYDTTKIELKGEVFNNRIKIMFYKKLSNKLFNLYKSNTSHVSS